MSLTINNLAANLTKADRGSADVPYSSGTTRRTSPQSIGSRHFGTFGKSKFLKISLSSKFSYFQTPPSTVVLQIEEQLALRCSLEAYSS